MLTLGIIVLILGLIALAVGRATRHHTAAVIGTYTAIAGAVLLAIGMIFYVLDSSENTDVDLDAAPTVVRLV